MSEADDDWEADLRHNLNSGEVWEKLEHSEDWWKAWQERTAAAPVWHPQGGNGDVHSANH